MFSDTDLFVGELQNLITLSLEGNPVCASSMRYVEILFASIPGLQTVDGRSRLENQTNFSAPRVMDAATRYDDIDDHGSVGIQNQESVKLKDKLILDQLHRDNEELSAKVSYRFNRIL